MTYFDHLESPLDEPPLFPIEAKDRDPTSEHARQAELVRKCRRNGWKVIAVPNARAWGMKAWNKVKAEGAQWGAPDLLIFAPGRVAAIEMKNGREMPEQHQVDCLNALHRMGVPCGVFRTANAALGFLARHGFEEMRHAA